MPKHPILAALKEAGKGWTNDNLTTHAGSLAYSTAFSLAPLLIIAIGICGLVFGEQASQGSIFNSLQGLLGSTGAHTIEDMVKSTARQPHAGLLATIIGVVTLIIGASSVFSQLQTSLNLIWHVRIKSNRSMIGLIRQRLLTFGMIAVMAFLLLVSLLVSAAVAAAGKFMSDRLPGGELLWHGVNFIVSFFVTSAIFAAIYKVLPDVKLRWRDVAIGATFTAFLFSVGKFVIGLYLGRSSIASSYGAAGSFIIVLLWLYYSSIIVYFGAEFIRAYVTTRGRKIEPVENAELTQVEVLR